MGYEEEDARFFFGDFEGSGDVDGGDFLGSPSSAAAADFTETSVILGVYLGSLAFFGMGVPLMDFLSRNNAEVDKAPNDPYGDSNSNNYLLANNMVDKNGISDILFDGNFIDGNSQLDDGVGYLLSDGNFVDGHAQLFDAGGNILMDGNFKESDGNIKLIAAANKKTTKDNSKHNNFATGFTGVKKSDTFAKNNFIEGNKEKYNNLPKRNQVKEDFEWKPVGNDFRNVNHLRNRNFNTDPFENLNLQEEHFIPVERNDHFGRY